VTDLNIPVQIKWQCQDGHVDGPIFYSSYTAAFKAIEAMQRNRLPLDPINRYWIESATPELTFKHII
jgi:hypothetical protein